MAMMRAYPELLPRPRPRTGSGRTLISELETENAYLRKLVIDLLLEKIRQYGHRQSDDLDDDGASRRRDRGRKRARSAGNRALFSTRFEVRRPSA